MEIEEIKKRDSLLERGYKEILNLEVDITDMKKTMLPDGKLELLLYFDAKGETPYFKGQTKEGAGFFDRQIIVGDKAIECCADYVMYGIDCEGKECYMHVTNRNDGNGWVPTLETDSKALAFVNKGDCHTLTEAREGGIRIFIYGKEE